MKNLLKRIPPTTLVWLLVILLALIWGSSYLILKKSLVVFSPSQVFAGRMFIAALCMLPFSIKQLRQIPSDKWLMLAAFAFVANFCTTFLNALAQTQISSALNGIFSALTPLMTFLIGIVFYRQVFQPRQMRGLLLGLLGTVLLLIFSPENEVGTVNLFALIAVLATFFTGLTANMIQFNLRGLSVIQIAAAAFLIILPFSGAYAWFSGFFHLAAADEAGRIAFLEIVFLAIFANVLGILIFTKLVEISSSVFASLVTYLVPVIALFWGLWDGEKIIPIQLAGMAIIILSVWAIGRNMQDKEDEEIL